jgi:hypothetical protein
MKTKKNFSLSKFDLGKLILFLGFEVKLTMRKEQKHRTEANTRSVPM